MKKILQTSSNSNILADMLHAFPSVPRGIEWISLTGFISFATSTPNNLGLVRNELQLVDLPTGLCFLRNLLQELTDLLGSDKFWLLFFYLSFLLSWQNKIINRSCNCSCSSWWSHKLCFVWCSADRLEPTPLQKHLGLTQWVSVSRGFRSSHTGY